jgi:polyisoprenoid-binding protein YceI
VVVGLNGVSQAADETYRLDTAHAGVVFKIRHLDKAYVFGRFNELAGEVVMDGKVAKAFQMTIQAASIDTNNRRRDDHLRSPDFFNVAQFPLITFKSTRIEPSGDGYNITGDLTMHGVTKAITIPVQQADPTPDRRGTRAGFTSEFTVQRADYGITYMPDGLGNDVHLMVSFEVTK